MTFELREFNRVFEPISESRSRIKLFLYLKNFVDNAGNVLITNTANCTSIKPLINNVPQVVQEKILQEEKKLKLGLTINTASMRYQNYIFFRQFQVKIQLLTHC